MRPSLYAFIQVCAIGQTLQIPYILNFKPANIPLYDDVEGSPYLFKDWMAADIIMKAGNTYEAIPIKINVYDDKIYFQRNDTTYELYPLDIISELNIVNKSDPSKNILISKGYMYDGNIVTDKIVQIFSKGKVSLIKTFKKEIKQDYNYGQSKTVKSFADMSQYYIVKNGRLSEVKLTKNSLYDITDDKKDAMEAFLKKEDPNLKTPQGFARALNYYNSL